jgi:hypothetical protein
LEIEKREESGYARFQSTLDVAVLAIERMGKMGKDLGREARSLWKPLTIRMEDIGVPHRK